MGADVKILYHVTASTHLLEIATLGLKPYLDDYAQISGENKIFLTDRVGAGFWWDWVVDHDNIPVIMQVRVDATLLSPDEMGSHDSGGKSYWISTPIPAFNMKVWNGSMWIQLGSGLIIPNVLSEVSGWAEDKLKNLDQNPLWPWAEIS